MKSKLSIYQFYKFIYQYLRPYKLLSAYFLIANIIQTIFLISVPLAYVEIFNQIVQHRTNILPNLAPFIYIALFLVAALLVGFVATFLSDLLAAKISSYILRDLRHDMFNKLNHLPLSYLHKTAKGKIIACFSSELMSIEQALTGFSSYALQLVLLSFSTILVIFYLEWRLGVLIVILYSIIYLFSRILTAYSTEANFNRKQTDAEFVALTNEISASQMIIRAYSLQVFWLKVAKARLSKLIESYSISNFFNALSATVLVLSSFIIEIAMILYGAYLVVHHQVSPGILVGLLAFIAYLLGTLQVVGYDYAQLTTAMGSLNRILHVILEQPILVQEDHLKSLPPLSKGFQVKQLTFSYDENQKILKNISLNIPLGKFTAIVGQNGSGKSTLLALLLGLYPYYRGEILIDGYEISSISETSFREQIGIVLQDSMLFNFPIYDNIRMGKLDASEQEIYAAAEQVGLKSIIKHFPGEIGEKGVLLSGGQRQKIAIARALIRHPKILFLDEITSSLDPASEREIDQIIYDLAKECTIVSITHRLYSITSADHIFVLNDGNLVEFGTHQSLLAQNGLYRKMWERQQEQYKSI